jgi:hypothetical protein
MSLTLDQAIDALFDGLEDGTKCLCCGQLAKLYKRPIYSTVAAQLIRFYRHHGQHWGNLPDTPDMLAKSSGGGDFAKLRYWGIIEAREDEIRPDGSDRNGWWRVTDIGVSFIKGETKLKKYARVYDGELIDLWGDEASIEDALGKNFVYRELMAL